MSLVLESLKLTGFKSHPGREIHFTEKMVAITGLNGSGKTNLLDALHHLALTRSAFSRQDEPQVQWGMDFYRLDARLREGPQEHRLEMTWSPETKKKIRWDGKEASRIGEHIGRIPLVLVLPDDPYNLLDSSEWRRNLLDNSLSQAFPDYLQQLSLYKKHLNQRNALLRYFQEKGIFDPALLESHEEPLARAGDAVWAVRLQYLPQLTRHLAEEYSRLSKGKETVSMEYAPETRPLLAQLAESRKADLEAVRTLRGPHRDDPGLSSDGRPLKKAGSQGQQKTYLLALKLAQFRFLQEHTGRTPWLLLDDIFDKLDDQRIEALLQWVNQMAPDTRVFLTDARPERSRKLMEKAGLAFQEVALGLEP